MFRSVRISHNKDILSLHSGLSSAYVVCDSFEKTYHRNKDCDFGHNRELWDTQDNEDCRLKCIEYANKEGPGCCASSGNGKCSYHTKGKIVNIDSSTEVMKAIYCVTRYQTGNKCKFSLLNFI